jgi:hypothetical protein
MKIILAVFCFLFYFQSQAQDLPTDTSRMVEDVYKEPSKESKAYNKYRQVNTEPSYGLAKIKKLIKAIKTNDEDDPALSIKTFNSLSTKEKFTYCMIHPESFSQNCDAMPPVLDEQKKIFAFLPDAYDELSLSDRQMKFLNSNKDSVLSWIKQVATEKNRVGVNFKEVIVAIGSKSIVPFLVDFYKKTKKDHDILTTLILLMENAKYKPHMNSQMHQKLFEDSGQWPRYINLNNANADLILKRAMDFYNAK